MPGAIYAEKRSVKKLIFVSLILWGGLATLTGMVANVYLLIGIRFLLGVVEAAVMPAMLVYLCHWFTRAERSRANTFLILGNPVTILWMSVVSGYLVEHFSWRWMFIIEGLPAVIWAFIWWRLVDDRPRQAAWLSGSEKRALEDALAAEQQGIKPVKNYREAFRSPKVIVLSLQYFCWSIGVYGFVLWLPSILKHGANIDIIEAGWLSALPYLAAVIAMLGVSWASTGCRNASVSSGRRCSSRPSPSTVPTPSAASTSGCPTPCWCWPGPACTRPTDRSSPSSRKSSRPTSPAAPWR